MTLELITTGTELMLGRVLNTHQLWICRQLSDHGYEVSRQVAIPDTGPAIEQAVREALTRADWIMTTGGLGPTSDDITRERIAAVLGRPLLPDAEVLRRIHEFYTSRNRPRLDGVDVQALVPENATVLPNDYGTAPGLLMHIDPNPQRENGRATWLAMLPGPPRELRPMFTRHLLPRLQRESPVASGFACRTLRTTGIGESQVELRLQPVLAELLSRGLEIGYCARPGEVDVRLVGRGPSAGTLLEEAVRVAQGRVGEYVFGEGDDELETVVVRLLTERRRTLAVAESCTGGLLGHRLTNVPGSSEVFVGGWITYSNTSKQRDLGVHSETLAAHGAVSAEVAREMASGARRVSGADYALAITGIAGPSGGSTEKPVGTVFIALATENHVWVLNPRNVWDRATFKHVSTQQALELLRRQLSAPAHTR